MITLCNIFLLFSVSQQSEHRDDFLTPIPPRIISCSSKIFSLSLSISQLDRMQLHTQSIGPIDSTFSVIGWYCPVKSFLTGDHFISLESNCKQETTCHQAASQVACISHSVHLQFICSVLSHLFLPVYPGLTQLLMKWRLYPQEAGGQQWSPPLTTPWFSGHCMCTEESTEVNWLRTVTAPVKWPSLAISSTPFEQSQQLWSLKEKRCTPACTACMMAAMKHLASWFPTLQ